MKVLIQQLSIASIVRNLFLVNSTSDYNRISSFLSVPSFPGIPLFPKNPLSL